jgi:farnesyl-diphosphate farnesyltransferase
VLVLCRMFWPKEIWGKYAKSLDEFKAPGNERAAVQCLNNMVTDALRHGVFCLKYMALLEDPQIFNFCAIPQVMAFATLSLCYNNPQVFKGTKPSMFPHPSPLLQKHYFPWKIEGPFVRVEAGPTLCWIH